ncbi:hypothetical protein GOODEAATRI_027931 [Goodea atripinnis]|uniref:Uncharacterized protein n=1 Tax=Goodea atripinnis TaxID=208336 RepID=A0ABV0MVR1_9TELE
MQGSLLYHSKLFYPNNCQGFHGVGPKMQTGRQEQHSELKNKGLINKKQTLTIRYETCKDMDRYSMGKPVEDMDSFGMANSILQSKQNRRLKRAWHRGKQ